MSPAQPHHLADSARHRAAADTPTADQPKKPRRPIVPMTATEATSLMFVDLGLLILLADSSGLFLMALGLIGYVYGRLSDKPANALPIPK